MGFIRIPICPLFVTQGLNLQQKAVRSTTFFWVQLYGAVKRMHERGILHRDLKPANFYCNLDAKKVLISDLGSACSSRDTADILCEESGSVMFR